MEVKKRCSGVMGIVPYIRFNHHIRFNYHSSYCSKTSAKLHLPVIPLSRFVHPYSFLLTKQFSSTSSFTFQKNSKCVRYPSWPCHAAMCFSQYSDVNSGVKYFGTSFCGVGFRVAGSYPTQSPAFPWLVVWYVSSFFGF